MLDLQIALPFREELKSARLPPWLRENGCKLISEAGSAWCCVHTSGGMEYSIAEACSRSGIAFFIPLIISEKGSDKLDLLWPNYVFCRVTPEQNSYLAKNRRVSKILMPSDEADLLEHLRLFAPISRRLPRYLPGDRVVITSEPFTGFLAKVVGAIDLEGRLSLELAGSRYPIRLARHVNSIRPASGGKPQLDFVPASSISFVEEPTLLPREAEEVAASENQIRIDLRLELDALNEELVKYLAKHPDQLYQMQPRRFEMLVAHLMADMGYEVELTPESRDGGRDILAVFKLPAGEILTIVECKRYAPDRHIGIDIVERFLFTVDRRDNASLGLIASTSFFTEGARALERQFRWRLGLKDFNVLQGWLSNYGRWSVDESAGLWLPGTPWSTRRGGNTDAL